MKKNLLAIKKTIYLTVFHLVIMQLGEVNAQSNPNVFPESGKVGIGTNHPSSDLHVIGNLKIETSNFTLTGLRKNESLIDPDSNYYFLQLKNDGTIEARKGPLGAMPPAIGAYNPTTLCDKYLLPNGTFNVTNPQWYNGVNKLFTGCEAIFVGIGTTTPRVNLDVIGTTYSQKVYIGEANPTLGNNTVSPDFHLKSNNTGGNANATTFLVENRDRRLFQIQNDGLVRAREIKVDLATNWPDYVFKPTYSLLPLKEVKKYVAENGHLPNVPNALTIETDGLPLGEMNRLLLEKVEELTLYMIQMQEEQERLKLELEELKTKNLRR